MDGTFQALVAFALGAIPGVIVLELVEYSRPRLRERNGPRAFASYLILSLFVWAGAVIVLQADERLAGLLDAAGKDGRLQVQAYIALAWRLLLAAVTLGLSVRLFLWIAGLVAFRIEGRRRAGMPGVLGRFGDLVLRTTTFAFAWDRLLERIRRSSTPQIVHVRFRDGQELLGVLAADGSADFQADGDGIVLAAELLRVDGRLEHIPNSNGLFISLSAVASIAFIDLTSSDDPSDTLCLR